MSSAQERLAQRKRLLLARSSLQRLEIARELDALRAALRWPRAGLALAASPPVRKALLGLLLGFAGRGRLSRLLRMAAFAVVAVKVAGGLARRHLAQPSGASAPGAGRPSTRAR